MRWLVVWCLLLLVSPLGAGLVKVYLIAGQSNADGRGDKSALPRSPRDLTRPQDAIPVVYYTEGGATSYGMPGRFTTLRPGLSESGSGNYFGPEVTLGRVLTDQRATLGARKVGIIKYANGGTSLLSHWAADGTSSRTGDGPDYRVFQDVVRNGLAQMKRNHPNDTVELGGLLWYQGETDADLGGKAASGYAANLQRFVADVRATFGPMPAFIGRLSDHATFYTAPGVKPGPAYRAIRDAQTAAVQAMSDATLVSTDAAAFTFKPDGLHFDGRGQQQLGNAFADAILSRSTAASVAIPEPALLWLGAIGGLILRRRPS